MLVRKVQVKECIFIEVEIDCGGRSSYTIIIGSCRRKPTIFAEKHRLTRYPRHLDNTGKSSARNDFEFTASLTHFSPVFHSYTP